MLIGGLALAGPDQCQADRVCPADGAGHHRADRGHGAQAAQTVARKIRIGSPPVPATRPKRSARCRPCRPIPPKPPAAPNSTASRRSASDVARKRIFTRALLTVVVIFLVFAGILGTLWGGRARCVGRHHDTGRVGAIRDLRGDRRRVRGRAVGKSGQSCNAQRARPNGWWNCWLPSTRFWTLTRPPRPAPPRRGGRCGSTT